ncbi:exodeoxyribonuclease VII small subunit [Nocardioides seonyuensis]|uniref:Exodeoxyribonuclease 7 small subunit n=1 Tax=Nocardioides seonyuensis TaxID=2518371 RepID=A0A4P7IEY8_9ACTN|nr:exodeoxyribonuclease VII small subunit [Nocardioides seonyuensis]QBX54517.1 exodeoxyribonuclease VII small subunit [Nocardioides seonyuensis]
MPPREKATDKAADQAATETPTYEDARAELVEVVRTLETGGTTLEESLALWERGEALAKVCQEWLDGARKRLDAVIGDSAED